VSGDFTFRFTDRSTAAKAAIRGAIADALGDVAETLLNDANRTVPIEEGTLERSGVASVDRNALQSAVSYDTPYAVVQHEDPTLRHDPGRRDHWLIDTLNENRRRYLDYVADKVRSVLR
jgi:hypothetical protein